MKYFLLPFVLAASLSTATAFADNLSSKAIAPAAVAAPELFNAAQKTAIEKIIRDYLVTNPEVLVQAGQALQMKQQAALQEKANKVIPTLLTPLLHDPSSPVTGNSKGTLSIVEFYDLQCPHCQQMAPAIEAIIKANPNVRFIHKIMPIFGQDSIYAAMADLASQNQGKFAVFNMALLNSHSRLPKQTVLDIAKSINGLNLKQLEENLTQAKWTAEIQSTSTLAQQIGIMGTPAFIFVSGTGSAVKTYFIPGQTDQAGLQKGIDAVKQK